MKKCSPHTSSKKKKKMTESGKVCPTQKGYHVRPPIKLPPNTNQDKLPEICGEHCEPLKVIHRTLYFFILNKYFWSKKYTFVRKSREHEKLIILICKSSNSCNNFCQRCRP